MCCLFGANETHRFLTSKEWIRFWPLLFTYILWRSTLRVAILSFYPKWMKSNLFPYFRLKKAYILFNNIEHAEADIYCILEKVMNVQQEMYRTEADSSLKGVINPNSKNNTPILQRIITITDHKLKTLDMELFRAIKLQDVQTKTFLLRWIRCMHTREFSL